MDLETGSSRSRKLQFLVSVSLLVRFLSFFPIFSCGNLFGFDDFLLLDAAYVFALL